MDEITTRALHQIMFAVDHRTGEQEMTPLKEWLQPQRTDDELCDEAQINLETTGRGYRVVRELPSVRELQYDGTWIHAGSNSERFPSFSAARLAAVAALRAELPKREIKAGMWLMKDDTCRLVSWLSEEFLFVHPLNGYVYSHSNDKDFLTATYSDWSVPTAAEVVEWFQKNLK